MSVRSTSTQAVAEMFRTLDERESALLRRFIVAPTRPGLGFAARVVNHLGNGWLFGALALAMPLALGATGWRFVQTVAVSLALGFAIYPFIKKSLARVRPCNVATSYDSGVRPLDRYSCPSGHSMTAAIFAVPLVLLFPLAAPLFLAVWLVIGWSRLALGHHYPSDVVFGGVIGTVISALVCLWRG